MDLSVIELKELGVDIENLLEDVAKERNEYKEACYMYQELYSKEKNKVNKLEKKLQKANVNVTLDVPYAYDAFKAILQFVNPTLKLKADDGKYYLVANKHVYDKNEASTPELVTVQVSKEVMEFLEAVYKYI